MKYYFLFCILIVLTFLGSSCQNDRNINYSISQFGAVAGDSSMNTTTAVHLALKSLTDKDSVVLEFPKGVYHFYVDTINNLSKAFDLKHVKNLCIEGNGSEFIFHGPLMIGSIDSCENVKLQNFSIDWERPYITQGVVKNVGVNFIDLEIDKEQYPYTFSEKDSTFLGIGENWKLGVATYNLFDKDKQEIVYRTRDMPLGNDMFVRKAEEISPGLVRFKGNLSFAPEIGTYVALWHGRYMTEGFHLFGSRDINFENIDIFHCPSHGLVGVRCENIAIKDVNMKVNEKKGRVFSLIADAFHFNACRGLIRIDSCTHTGHGDDFINVHGMYIEISKVISPTQFITGTSQRQFMTIGPGDELWFIRRETLKRENIGEIIALKDTVDADNKPCKIVFLKNELPDWVKNGDFVENKSYLADFEIRNCNILKKHRARGILVTTPGKVLIENNYFRTAGAAILIEGDVNYWYESGSCKDVMIKNNVFEDCFTSGHEWGEAVITITPSYKPDSDNALCYHENIHIVNNVFRLFDYPLLYARAVNGLYFNDNKIERSYNYDPFYRESMFYLDGCKQIDISGNEIANDVLGKNIYLQHSKIDELKKVNEELTIKLVK